MNEGTVCLLFCNCKHDADQMPMSGLCVNAYKNMLTWSGTAWELMGVYCETSTWQHMLWQCCVSKQKWELAACKVSKMEKLQRYLPRSSIKLNRGTGTIFILKNNPKCLWSSGGQNCSGRVISGRPVASGLMQHIDSEAPSEWLLLLMNVPCAATCQRELEKKQFGHFNTSNQEQTWVTNDAANVKAAQLSQGHMSQTLWKTHVWLMSAMLICHRNNFFMDAYTVQKSLHNLQSGLFRILLKFTLWWNPAQINTGLAERERGASKFKRSSLIRTLALFLLRPWTFLFM